MLSIFLLKVISDHRTIFFIIFLIFSYCGVSYASYIPPEGNTNDVQYKNGSGFGGSDNFVINGTNVGIGTTIPSGLLEVGLQKFDVLSGGNVGIGSITPGQKLDVNGFIRSTSGGFVFPDGSTQIVAASGGNSWSMSNGNVYTTTPTNNVGIGTTTPQTGFAVLNGNVGIGTWTAAGGALIVKGGNVGIGTTNANQALTVAGTIYSTTGGIQFPDNSSQTTAAISSLWATQNVTDESLAGGNVGIGTIKTTTAALTVMNGNVGIGTWITAGGVLIVKGGNVGIGTTNANQALTVAGTIYSTTGGIQFPDNTTQTTAATGGNSWTMANGNVYTTTPTNNVGIGTTTPQTGLAITNGNVGIGTWTAAGGALMIQGGNVGIGTVNANKTLTVNGTIYSTSGGIQFPDNTSQTTAATSSLWATQNSTDESLTGGNVGIGTIKTTTAALTVMNGNVGIGTWVPSAIFAIGNDAFTVNSIGAITATTGITNSGAYIQNGAGNANTFLGTTSFNALSTSALFAGNVGIGSLSPGQTLDVNGTVRMAGLTMSGGSPSNGFVLTAVNSNGDATWSPSGSVGSNYWALIGGVGNVGLSTTNTIGIGTTSAGAGAGLVVMNGNVGIGTWAPSTTLAISGSVSQNGGLPNTISGPTAFSSSGTSATFAGNVGIGSLSPGQNLDVNGTVRTTSFTMSSGSPSNGFVLTAVNSSGEATWSPSGSVGSNYWALIGGVGNVGLSTTNTVGIGTTSGVGAGLVVMGGNVGIGTWVPAAPLTVGANAFTVNSIGAITATTGITNSGSYTQTGTGTPNTFLGTSAFNASGTSATFANNVGIGSLSPGQTLDVNGTVRMTGLTMSSGSPSNGFVLTAVNSNGDATWSPSGSVGTNYWALTGGVGNVGLSTTNTIGIGTTSAGAGAGLVVMNGNVGIGTWVPGNNLAVNGGITSTTLNVSGTTISSNGAITGPNFIDTYLQSSSGGGQLRLNAQSGNLIFETGSGTGTEVGRFSQSGNLGIGSTAPGQALDVNGTVRMAGLILSNNGASVGNVLVTNAVGVGTWMPANTLATVQTPPGGGLNAVEYNSPVGSFAGSESNFSFNGTNVGVGTSNATNASLEILKNGSTALFKIESTVAKNGNYLTVDNNGNVGIGTNNTGNAGLSIMNGNVGIGTLSPLNLLHVSGTNGGSAGIYLNSAVPSGTTNTLYNNSGTLTWNGSALATGSSISGTTNYLPIFTGPSALGDSVLYGLNNNIGIGSINPGQALDVNGTARATYFAMTGASPTNGEVLTATDSLGDMTWSSSGSVGTNYWSLTGGAGNVGISTTNTVGIGTTSGVGAGLVVMGGNVGIGTWIPSTMLQVGSNFKVASSGALTVNPSGTAGVGVSLNGVYSSVNSDTGALQLFGDTWMESGNAYHFRPADNSYDFGFASYGSGSNAYIQWGADYSGGVFLQNIFQAYTNGNSVWGGRGTFVGVTSSANVGIGTTNPFGGGLIVLPANTGNVGIGSLTPGQALDVNGTVRATYLAMTGGAPSNGEVLTATDSLGDMTWSSSGSVGTNYWLNTAGTGNVGISTTNTVGIGTTSGVGAGLVVMNGNVGIGTWVPAALFDIGTNNGNDVQMDDSGDIVAQGSIYTATDVTASAIYIDNSNGGFTTTSTFPLGLGVNFGYNALVISATNNVGIGTVSPTGILEVEGGNVGIGTWTTSGGQLIVSTRNGNVGIGTIHPGQALDVQGTVRATGFIAGAGGITLGGVNNTTWPSGSNYWLNDSGNVGINTMYNVGIGTSFVPSGGGNGLVVYGNVGIGTTSIGGTGEGALSVMNGNVGIGTWVPGSLLNIEGGNLGIGTNSPQTSLVSMGNVGIGTWTAAGGNLIVNGGGNVGIGTAWPGVALDVVGSIRASTVQTVNITSTPYTISSGQNGVYFTYTDAATGTINLPALSGLNNGFTITIARQVPQSLTIAANGSDTFPNTVGSLEMRGQNIATITLMKAGSFWNIVNKTDDCIVGQACWYSNMIYAGTFNGHQYFTTPGNCTNSATPTCNGATDTQTFAFASNTGGAKKYNTAVVATDLFYGATQTATLAANYSDTAAAKFCKSMTYDGHSDNDWYLPAASELAILYQNKVQIGGFINDYSDNTGLYWSSTELNPTLAWYFDFSYGDLGGTNDTYTDYVRCVRRY